MARSIGDYRLYGAIRSQPSECARLLSEAQDWERAASALSGAGRVWCVGIGTSYNAARAASWMLRAAGLEAHATTSMEFSLWPPLRDGDAAMVFAHTGRKTATGKSLALLEAAGAPTVLVTGIESELEASSLGPSVTALRTTRQDPSAMYTVSHTGAMTVSARVAEAVSPGCLGDLGAIPSALEVGLGLESEVAEVAGEWSSGALIALGSGPLLAAADEAQIKIAEASRRSIRYLEGESFMHGPQVQIGSGERVLGFASADAGLERMREVVWFCGRNGLSTCWVAPSGASAPEGCDVWLEVAELSGALMPIAVAAPTQLLAGYLAAQADVDADGFRRDDASFASALGEIGL